MSDDEEKTLDEIEELAREGDDPKQALLQIVGYARGLEQRLATLEERVDELEESGEDEEEADEDE